LQGFSSFYGKSIFHLGVYARNKNGFELAISLQTWSKKITLYLDGKDYLKPLEKEKLKEKNIDIVRDKIMKLEEKKVSCGILYFVIIKRENVMHCFL
jgi:hypothetical protein